MRVTYHDKSCSGRNCLKQCSKKKDVHHRHFVHDYSVNIKWIVLVTLKAGVLTIFVNCTVKFEKSVDGLRFIAGCLSHSFGSSAGGCRERYVHAFGFEVADKRFNRSSLSRAGAAGDYGYTVCNSLHNCLGLKRIKGVACLRGYSLDFFGN